MGEQTVAPAQAPVVIPAKAGISCGSCLTPSPEIPAFAGTTELSE